ncbi:MAG: molybdenum cofactor biosynthesis protein MoaE [Thermodesulfobacteriota bacterium]
MAGLVRIQSEDFSVEEEVKRIKTASKEVGGVVSFLGTARDISKGEKIVSLEFEHYPVMAEKKLDEIRKRALDNYNIIEMGIVHRVGRLDIGENIVLIVAAARHRNDAFMACEWAIAELKRVVPIWKKETTGKGEVWVEEHP